MKSEIIIFFVWAVCFNIVASYHHYSGPGYRQEAYQQRPDWSNNQNYAPNQNPAYPLNQPSAINYGPPQPVVNFRRDPPIGANYEQDENYPGAKQEPIYVPHPQEVILEPRFQQQVIANSQSDDVYAEPQPEPSPHTFSEVPRPYLPEQTYPDVARPYLPERSHESFVAQPPHWQSQPPPPSPPPPPAFVQESYLPQVPRHWQPQNSYPPSLPIQQEPYPQPASYPHWQSTGYKTEPQKNPFYASAYDKQNTYNPPLQYAANAHAQASSASADKSQEKPASQKLFLLFHPNGTKAHVDFIERDLSDNSQYVKSSNINNANLEEKNLNVRQENLYNKPDSTTPDNKNQFINLNEPYQNNDFLPEQRPIIVKETNDAVPAKEYYVDNVNKPRNDLLKMNNENYPDSNIAVKPVSDYRPISVFKTNQPQENRFLEHNIAPAQSPFVWNNNKNNNFRKHINNEPILTTLNDIKEKKYENLEEDIKKISESLVPLREEAFKKYNEQVVSHPVKTNPITNFNLPSTEVEESNNYQNPTLDSLPKIEENYYYPSEFKYLNTPQVQNKSYDTVGSPSEYTDKSVSNYVTNIDAPVPSDDLTTNTLPNDYLIKSNNPDDININPNITPAKKSNYDVFEIKDQTKVSANESNDGTGSNVKNNPGDANPSTHEYTYDEVNITSLLPQNTDGKNIDISDTYNTVSQTVLNSTSLQKFETDPDNDDSQATADSIEGSYNSSIIADEIKALSPIEKERTPKEDSLTNIDITNTGAEEAENQQPENINSNDEAKTDKESGENGDVIDSSNSIAANKPVIMMRPDDGFWDGLYSENEAGAYDGCYFCDVKITDLVIERTSKFYMYENRSFVEETEEIVWEHKDDAIPIEIRTTKIIRNPKVDFRPKIDGSDGVPKCYKPHKTS